MVVADARREVEPRLLRFLQRLEPRGPALRRGHRGQHLARIVMAEDNVGEVPVHCATGQLAELVVRPQQEIVDAADHLRERSGR